MRKHIEKLVEQDADFVKKWSRAKGASPLGPEFKSRIEKLQERFKPRAVKVHAVEDSEFPELMIIVPDAWEKIILAPLYDVHIGSGDHDEDLFDRHLDWIARTPNVLTWNGGDMVENAVKDSPGASPLVQKGTPSEQLFKAAKKLTGIQHKMLFAIPGNHEDRTFNVAGLDGAQQLAEHLRLPYFPDYCLAPETRILTTDFKWIPIGKIDVGQTVLAFDEHSEHQTKDRGRKWRVAAVQEKKLIRRPCYRIHLSDGTKIIASAEHKWLVSRAGAHYVWEETKNLKPLTGNKKIGRTPAIVKAMNTWEETADRSSGYLAAAFDGEGTVRQYRGSKKWYALGLSFAQKENRMLSTVQEYLTKANFRFTTRLHSPAAGVMTVDILGGVPEYIRFLGQMRPQRLIQKFDLSRLGRFSCQDRIEVERIEDIGEQEVIALKTSTGTFIAEGFASHNCFCTIKWRGNSFRVCAHHGSGAAQTPGAQRNSARKDMPWSHFDFYWTGHLHQPMADVVFQTDFDQETGRIYERSAVVMISPSYVKYFGGYAAKKRMAPGARGLTAAELNADGRIDVSLHARGKRL